VKLHSPGFERKLRRGVKQAVHSSRALKREYRANRWRKHYHLNVLLRPLLSLGFGFVVWYIAVQTGHGITGVAAINLWTMAWVFVRAQNLRMNLYAASDLPALSMMPLPAHVIFRWELWKFLRASLPSLLDLAVGFGALAWFAGLSVPGWVGIIPIAILSWLTLVTLAVLCIARVPRLPYPLIASGLLLAGIAVFFARSFMGAVLIAALDRVAPTANWLLPTGWPASLFLLLPPNHLWAALGLLVPIGLLFWTVTNSLAVLRKNYRFGEIALPEAADLPPDAAPESSLKGDELAEAPRRIGLTAIEDIVESRQFLARPKWPDNGWFERRLWDWLNEREKALAEFAFPDGINLSDAWIKVARNFAVVALAAWAAQFADATLMNWVLGAGLLVVFLQVFAVVLGTGAAFRAMVCSGVKIPLYAAYAIGYRELAGLLFKCSVVQLPLAVAFLTLCGAVVGWLADLPIVVATVIGFKMGFLLMSARLILIALAFSSGTNDSTRLRLKNLPPLAIILGCAAIFLVLGGTGLFVPGAVASWVLWLLALLDAYAFFRIYGWFYNGNRFDLMSLPRP
jgi:hypothetical protein